MIRLDCPVCGLRDETEFAFGGDASATPPDIGETNAAVWHDYVFLRANPRGPHREFWHHVHGCRQILIVERNTVTHEIISCRLAKEEQP